MRKFGLVVALVLILTMAVAAPALAAKPNASVMAMKLKWFSTPSGSSDVLSSTLVPGHVNINTPRGAVTLIINGVIKLSPSTTYTVWARELSGYTGSSVNSYLPLGYFALGTFTTDADGYGHFHFNILKSKLPAGTRNIQIAVNTGTEPAPSTAYGATVAATKKFAVVKN